MLCEIKTGILTALVFVDQKTADETVHSDRKHRLSQSKKSRLSSTSEKMLPVISFIFEWLNINNFTGMMDQPMLENALNA